MPVSFSSIASTSLLTSPRPTVTAWTPRQHISMQHQKAATKRARDIRAHPNLGLLWLLGYGCPPALTSELRESSNKANFQEGRASNILECWTIACAEVGLKSVWYIYGNYPVWYLQRMWWPNVTKLSQKRTVDPINTHMTWHFFDISWLPRGSWYMKDRPLAF